MNDELISELKKYVTSDEPRPKELLQMNNAIGDTLELLETLDPLEKFQNTGVFIRVGLLH